MYLADFLPGLQGRLLFCLPICFCFLVHKALSEKRVNSLNERITSQLTKTDVFDRDASLASISIPHIHVAPYEMDRIITLEGVFIPLKQVMSDGPSLVNVDK